MFHPFYVKNEDGTGERKAASNLKAGDEFLSEDGKKVKVSEVKVEKLAEEITVYNLELDEVYTYYVAGGVLLHNRCATDKNSDSEGGKDTTRVGRWMSQDEYDKMVSSGKVQMSGDNKVHVANPADINAFGKQASKGSLYVEFDVPSNTVSKGVTDGWGIINGPGSLLDRLNAKKGLPRITEMPNATNIMIGGSK